jgi:hypothetical protein
MMFRILDQSDRKFHNKSDVKIHLINKMICIYINKRYALLYNVVIHIGLLNMAFYTLINISILTCCSVLPLQNSMILTLISIWC